MNAIVVLLLCIGSVLAKTDSIYTSVSGFYTGGDLEPEKTSVSYAGYLGIGYGNYGATFGYDALRIDSTDWHYNQKNIAVSPYMYFYPFYLKVAYMSVTGDFKPDPVNGQSFTFESDKTTIINAEAGMYGYYYSTGIGYTQTQLTGYKSQKTHQISARYQFIPQFEWLVGIKPSLISVSDGRKYFSVALKTHYLLFTGMILKASVNIGNRVYYFDNDLLTVFNQDQTQNKHFGIQADYYLGKFVLQAAWQYNEFDKLPTRYFIAGLKYGTYIGF